MLSALTYFKTIFLKSLFAIKANIKPKTVNIAISYPENIV